MDREAAIARGDFLEDDLPADESEKEAAVTDEVNGEELDAADATDDKDAADDKDAGADDKDAGADDKDATDDKDAGADDKDDATDDKVVARDEKGRFGIPKARFDEAVGKERAAREAAELRVKELERQMLERTTQTKRSEEIAALESKADELALKHAELLIDGDKEEAGKIMAEIRRTERQIARMESQEDARSTTTQILEAERFELAVATLEANHPELNPQSESYDEELVELILAKQAALVQREGLPPSKAIVKATESILKRFARPPEEKPVETGLSKGKDEASKRKRAQVEKNLDTQARQPPSLKEVGVDSDKLGAKGLPNINEMSAEEYNALPESTKARLRGDLG